MKKLLALALLAPLLAVPTAPSAQAAGTRAAKLVTTYGCDSDYGSGSSEVALGTKLPTSVKAGKKVGERTLSVVLVVPEDLTDMLRDYGVTAVKGSSGKAPLTVGSVKVPVRGLKIPRTPMPDEGELVLRGTGTVAAFTMPKAGSFAVKVPARLVADLTGYVGGLSASTTLTCAVADDAPVRLGTLRVTG